MRRKVVLVFMTGMMWTSYVVAQNTNNFFHLRSVQSSLLMEFSRNTTNHIYTDSYGTITSLSQSSSDNINGYLFQAQEYDSELKLSFFPSRIYSSAIKRFNQPDPKSQFHSPYLFVGSDPVNNVDRDGNVGRPLVLHGLDNGKAIERGSFHDAHDYSLTDFVNKKIPDLPDWDGNVYISGHMKENGRIELERANTEDLISMDKIPSHIHYDFKEYNNPRSSELWQPRKIREFKVEMDADKFGKDLKEFSAAQRVKLNNVVFAGCEGGVAAEQAADAFESHNMPTEWVGDEVNFFGTKKGYILSEIAQPADKAHTTWSWLPKEHVSTMEGGYVMLDDKAVPVSYYKPRLNDRALPAIVNPTEPTAEEMLLHGRLTSTAQSMVDHIPVGY